MDTDQAKIREMIEKAVEAERARCTSLMDIYRSEFSGSPLQAVWTRVRNLIATGAPASQTSLHEQLGELEEDRSDFR
ncbi:hypothetical protein VN12_26240 [Pirellula sp. SH-Sr6A]|jgi:hypothetical protein|nr:hypothetical protein VN12_26240 [Pirellula sp. SH-Sr6A]